MDRLRVLSQTSHGKLTDVAQSLVDDAARRARARHVEDPPESPADA